MQSKPLILFLLCMWLSPKITIAGDVFERIKQQRVGVAVGKVSLHSDTALHTQTNMVFSEGEIFEILGESQALHFDKDENQKFKWYFVQAQNKEKGWLFGDAFAIATLRPQLDSLTSPLLHKEISFLAAAEQSLLWFAHIEGIEIKGNQYLSNPLYEEHYLVVTNPQGKSTLTYLSGRGLEGEQLLKNIALVDLTNDQIPELVVEKSAYNSGILLDNRSIEIFTFKSSGWNKIFEETLSLKENDNTPTPALYKVVEIENQLIRVSFVDFLDCKDYRQNHIPNTLSVTQERCVEYVTYTFAWDDNMSQFKPIYAESRLPLLGYAKQNYNIYTQPKLMSEVIGNIATEAELTIIQTYNSYQTDPNTNEAQALDIWLYIETRTGEKGYIPAYQVYFGDAEHAIVLHDYFNHTPLYLGDWKSEEPFLIFKNNN